MLICDKKASQIRDPVTFLSSPILLSSENLSARLAFTAAEHILDLYRLSDLRVVILKGRVPIFRKWDEWPLQSIIVGFDFQFVVRLCLRIRLPVRQLRDSRCGIGR